ncbi:hypothetical protein LRB11_17245, partial [Ectothiorhodospira haloalkaliphila]|uniref:hypothetical protein n=1 Tax=Ectothiorhodospira haloalkaliphila TaxID=421628 RepID=UPI001EE93295
ENGVLEYEADADTLREDGDDAVTFQLASAGHEGPSSVQVTITHFSAGDILDLTAIDVEGTPVIDEASHEDGQLSITLSTQDGVTDGLPTWSIELVDVDPDLVATLGDDLVAGLDNADWFLT